MGKSVVLWVLLMTGFAAAQPAFDVASVKPSPPPEGDLININLGGASHGVVTLANTTLSECIRYAYGLANEDQIAGPDWIRDRHIRFDITAKAPPATPPDQLLAMMQTLLAQRFHLVLHREPRRIPHFELTVAKNGPKLPAAPGDGPSVRRYYEKNRLSYTHVPMDRFAVLLSRVLGQPVFDKTALKGAFDVELDWTPDDAAPAPAETDSAPRPDIFAAIQQQLGLKLEASKQPVEVLVVDEAEKVPVAN
ncbi:MAG: TIGR03435 family protein [Candidatus Sulfopaludibacter sp.]|nr:TIGR03435 family protein [Candidatus Sulfopaludibacter sp.]